MKKHTGIKSFCFSIVGFLALGTVVHADMESHSASIPLQTTNWDINLAPIPLFDPSLGTLNSVEFMLTGEIEGDLRWESLDAAPTTVDLKLQATITLQRPDNSVLVVTIPVANISDPVSAFDGLIDFGGTSGGEMLGLMASTTESFTTFDAADLALFTGVGNIVLPVSAEGTSTGSGAGNLLLQFNTDAGAGVIVKYNFTPIPEPSTALLVVGGLVGVGLVLKRRSDS